MQQIMRWTAAIAAFLILLLSAAMAQGEIREGGMVSGVVRVYLSSIASLSSVDLTVDGSYSVEGDMSRAIARGAKVSIANSGGKIALTVNGERQTLGASVRLRRHETSGNNGVTIAQARYPRSLYPGDIECIARDNGKLQIIVHVYMEDYLRGVLPYEMDNSFPLEALKAQAIAARTYALRKMSAHATTYDVVDTTNDQVYNGTPTGNARCFQAVEETAGIVGTVGGEFMASYFTASNGGQTESVANAWGSGSYSYLQVKDDPYDLRNSASVQKSVTFYKNGKTSVTALTNLLVREAASATGQNSAKIEAIISVTPHTPRYAKPSRVYSKLDIGLRVAGYGDVTVTLDYFSQVEGICSLSINALKNETVSVDETADSFRLTARRFGHGVGMSQRGAQQMAAEGMTYDQILEFYYLGIVRTHYTMTRTMLQSMDSTIPDPTAPPVAESETMTVSLENAMSRVNLRAKPDTTSQVLAQIAHGTRVTLLDRAGEWSFIQHGTTSGYIKNEYLIAGDDRGRMAPNPGQGSATVSLSDEAQTLNLRARPMTTGDVLAQLHHGDVLTVLDCFEEWTLVRYAQTEGYVRNEYVAFGDEIDLQDMQKQEDSEEDLTGLHAIVLPSAGLNLRADASADSSIVMKLPQGAQTEVIGGKKNGMLPVQIGAVSGYVAAEYVYLTDEPVEIAENTPVPETTPEMSAETEETIEEEAQNEDEMPEEFTELVKPAEPTAVPGPTPTPMGSGILTGRPAVITAVGGLNLRREPSQSAGVLTTLARGTQVSVIGDAQDGFYMVCAEGYTGYVSEKYVSFDLDAANEPTVEPTAVPTPAPPIEVGGRVVVQSKAGLNLRAEPNAQGEVLYVLPFGMVLTVLEEESRGFLHVQWAQYEGYVSAEYVIALATQGTEE